MLHISELCIWKRAPPISPVGWGPSKPVLTPDEGAWKRTSGGRGPGSSSSSTVGALVGEPWRSPLEPRDGIQSRNFRTYFLCIFMFDFFLDFYILRFFTGIFSPIFLRTNCHILLSGVQRYNCARVIFCATFSAGEKGGADFQRKKTPWDI